MQYSQFTLFYLTYLYHFICQFQEGAEDALVDFFVVSMQPFSLIESEEFRYLLRYFQGLPPEPKFKFVSRKTFTRRVKEYGSVGRTDLKALLKEPRWVAATADSWSSHQRAFIGVTCTYLRDTGEDSKDGIQRVNGTLACQEVKGQQTATVIADALTKILQEFDVLDKCRAVVTDNGANYVAAFTQHGGGGDQGADGEEPELLLSPEEEELKQVREEEDIEDAPQVINVYDALTEANLAALENHEPLRLPRHLRCQ